MGLVLSGGDLIKIAKSNMRSTCRKVKSQASCPENIVYQLAKSRLELPLEPVTSKQRDSPILLKHMTFHILLTHAIHTLITHRKCKRAYREKNPKRGFYNTPTLLERELLILREKYL